MSLPLACINEEVFKFLLEKKLGDHYGRALLVFQQYGNFLSGDVTNILLHAVEKGKIEEIMSLLEKHYGETLQFQHPDARGRIIGKPGRALSTEDVFIYICKDILCLWRYVKKGDCRLDPEKVICFPDCVYSDCKHSWK